MAEKVAVDHRRLVAVAPHRMPRPGGGIADHGNLEALLDRVAQTRTCSPASRQGVRI